MTAKKWLHLLHFTNRVATTCVTAASNLTIMFSRAHTLITIMVTMAINKNDNLLNVNGKFYHAKDYSVQPVTL